MRVNVTTSFNGIEIEPEEKSTSTHEMRYVPPPEQFIAFAAEKRGKNKKKQVKFELDPPISNLGLTFSQANVI